MWLIKMKHKKLQLLLTGILLLASAGLLNMCLCIAFELKSFSHVAINETNSPDGYVFDIGTKNFKDNFPNTDYLDEIESVTALTGKAVTAPILYNGNDFKQMYDLMLSADGWKDFGYLELVDGEDRANGPKKGEVWLAEVLTETNNMKLGDTLTLHYAEPLELIISGVFRSTCFPKAVGYSPMLVNPADLETASHEQDGAMFAVNIKDYSSDRLIEMFQESQYSFDTRSRDVIRNSMMSFSDLIASVGVLASSFIFIISMVILGYIIRNNLMKEYRTIGVYKSLGYTSKSIAGFYIAGYMTVGVIAVVLGSFASINLVESVGNILAAFVTPFKLSGNVFAVTIFTILVILALLYLNLRLQFAKIKKISPVEAISIGTAKTERKLPQSAVKNAKTPFMAAVNELIKYKKSSALLLLAITLPMFLCLFFGMAWNSADTILDNGNLWFNLPKSELYVTGRLNNDAQDYISHSKYVKTAVYGDYGLGNCKLEGYPDAPDYELYDVYSSFPEESTEVRMAEGKSPKNKYDAAVSTNLLSKLHLSVGDPLPLTIGGITKDYTISGSYETMGTDIMLTAGAVSECIDYTPSRAFIFLNDINDYERFKRDIEMNLPETAVYKEWFALKYTIKSVSDMIKPISLVLIIAFVSFSLLSVIIVLMADNKNWRRKYGIMKALGFRALYIIRQSGFKYCIIAAVSSALALGLHILFSQKLAAMVLVDAFRSSAILDAFIIGGFILLITLSAIIISLSVKKISPIELME